MNYAVVTGASAGIGEAIARQLAKRGKNLILVARRADKLQELQTQLQDACKVEVVAADLSQPSEVARVAAYFGSHSVDILVNNAGFGGLWAPLKDFIGSDTEAMLNLNINALTHLTHAFVAECTERGTEATLMNVSSVVGYSVSTRLPVYSATKFYVSAFTEAIHSILQGSKVRVKLLAPAATESEFLAVATQNPDARITDISKLFHTSEQMGEFAMQLFDSDKPVGIVNLQDYRFELKDPLFRLF